MNAWSCKHGVVPLTVMAMLFAGTAGARGAAADTALSLHATATARAGETLTITLVRWPTDAERAPLLNALSAPASPTDRGSGPLSGTDAAAAVPARGRAPSAPAAPGRGTAAGARGSGGAGARGTPPGGRTGGRGGRGRGGAPASPTARLSAAVRAAPTLGYIWGNGATGYSIKYAWRSPSSDRPSRLVLVTDRRMDLQAPESAIPPATSDAEADFTVIEIHIDANGTGEAKTSLTAKVLVDASANTLALENYSTTPALLRISR